VKIIFLDMDGVLCTTRSHLAQGHDPAIWHQSALDREGVGLLNLLCEEVGDVQYVLSSTWRRDYSKEWMESHLREFGWKGVFHDDWKTHFLNTIRGIEIEDWLNRHITEWDTFVILDDNSDMTPEQKEKYFVQTDAHNGIMFEHWQKARAILKDTNCE
jgi:hypothetical protein